MTHEDCDQRDCETSEKPILGFVVIAVALVTGMLAASAIGKSPARLPGPQGVELVAVSDQTLAAAPVVAEPVRR